MLIARSLDALAARCGSAVLACDLRAGSCAPPHGGLCIRAMRRGREVHCLSQRVLCLDEDGYLIANAGSSGCAAYHGDGVIRPLVVFFDNGMVERAGASGSMFLECLRPHGDAVSRRLQAIEARLENGFDDTRWFNEQIALLLQDAIEGEGELRHQAQRIHCVKPATRDELFRRVLLARDFILSYYDQPITLDDIAGAARLSPFHLLRLFHRTHGVTPHACLHAKRLAVASRMLAQTDCDLSEIAERSGFGTRSSLFRHLRKQCGAGGRRLRSQVAGGPAWRAQPFAEQRCRTTA